MNKKIIQIIMLLASINGLAFAATKGGGGGSSVGAGGMSAGGGARGFSGGAGMGRSSMGGSSGFAGRSAGFSGSSRASLQPSSGVGRSSFAASRPSVGASMARPTTVSPTAARISPSVTSQPRTAFTPTSTATQSAAAGRRLSTRPAMLQPTSSVTKQTTPVISPATPSTAGAKAITTTPSVKTPTATDITKATQAGKTAIDQKSSIAAASKTAAGAKGQAAQQQLGKQAAAKVTPQTQQKIEQATKAAGLNKQTIANQKALKHTQLQAQNKIAQKVSPMHKKHAQQLVHGKKWHHWHRGPGNWNAGLWGIGWWPLGNWNWGWNWAWNNGVWWWGGYPWWWWYDYDPVYFQEVVYPVYVAQYQDVSGDRVYNYWDITNNTGDVIIVDALSGDQDIQIEPGQTQRVFHTQNNYKFTVETSTGTQEYNTPARNINVVSQRQTRIEPQQAPAQASVEIEVGA